MATIRLQILFNAPLDFLKIVKETYLESLASSMTNNSSDEDLKQLIELKYTTTLSSEKTLSAFEVNADLSETQIKMFCQSLSDRDEVSCVFKFYDDSLLGRIQKFATEIFDIEMKLREALSLTFLMRYPDDVYDLFKEVNVSPLKNAKSDWNKTTAGREQRLKKRFENELFHILFSDYHGTSDVKPFKEGELLNLVQDSSDFFDLQRRISSRGIQGEIFEDLLAGLKEHSDPLEKLRNCVAHNREPSDDEVTAYEYAKKSILEHLDSFWKRLLEPLAAPAKTKPKKKKTVRKRK